MSSGYLYESAKDVLEWNGLKPKDYIQTVMIIGTIVNLDDENFAKAQVGSRKLTPDEIERML